MISVSEARQRLLSALPICSSEMVSLSSAVGRVLFEDLTAGFDSPRFANSSMDGFAVRSEDIHTASDIGPARLKVVADIPAGSSFEGQVGQMEAARIMTGAPLPNGADAVVPVEDTDAEGGRAGVKLPEEVSVMRSVDKGGYVRQPGEDYQKGDRLLPAGTRLGAAQMALLASLGLEKVSVYKRPQVAYFSSGDELVTAGREIHPGEIYEANSFALAALIASCECEAIDLGIARDSFEDVKAHLEKAIAEKADLILSSAGVSVGAFDFLREALLSNGRLDFWKVNMRPGKPFTFGEYAGIPYIGLPGNPASAYVGFEVFVRPALQHMAGASLWKRTTSQVRLAENIESDGRETYLRGKLSKDGHGQVVLLTGHQGSGNLLSLALADCLVIMPAGTTHLEAGSTVDVWPM